MASGLLDALIYNPSTSAGKRRYERERAENYSQVYRDAERNLAMAGQKPEHHPMRMAEQLLRSGNPTAVKTGEAMMTQYHAGKTGDIKEHEYGLTLSEEEAQDWMNRNLRSGQDVFGTPLKVRRKDGSIGYFVPRKSQNGPYLQDMGQDAYVEEKVVQLGGGQQGIYRDGQGRLVVGPQGDATAQANGYQGLNIPPEAEAAINQILRQYTQQPAGQQPQGQPQQQSPAARYQQQPPPQAQPQTPTVRPVTPEQDFERRAENVAWAEGRGAKRGQAEGIARGQRGEDYGKYNAAVRRFNNVRPEIEQAISIIDTPGLLKGGNWATGGIYEIENFRNALPFGHKLPGIERWVGTDAKRLRDKIKVLKSNLSVDQLAQMRSESTTGGALGNVTDKDLEILETTIGNLDQSQRPDDMVYNLMKIYYHYDNAVKSQEVAFLMKHKHGVTEGQGDYDYYMYALEQSIRQVYGNTAKGQEMLERVMRLQ